MPLLKKTFSSNDIFELITSNTNKRIDGHLDKLRTFKEHNFNSSKYIWLEQATKEELKTFIAHAYFRRLYGMNHHSIKLLFKSGILLKSNPDIFGATMLQQRMRFLLAHITFDDKSTRKHRWPSDRFTAGRGIFETFKKNCSKCVILSEDLAIEKNIVPHEASDSI